LDNGRQLVAETETGKAKTCKTCETHNKARGKGGSQITIGVSAEWQIAEPCIRADLRVTQVSQVLAVL